MGRWSEAYTPPKRSSGTDERSTRTARLTKIWSYLSLVAAACARVLVHLPPLPRGRAAPRVHLDCPVGVAHVNQRTGGRLDQRAVAVAFVGGRGRC